VLESTWTGSQAGENAKYKNQSAECKVQEKAGDKKKKKKKEKKKAKRRGEKRCPWQPVSELYRNI
jgi:hypothetical protein